MIGACVGSVQEVLDARHVKCGAGEAAQYLVRWQGYDPVTREEWRVGELASWVGPTAP